MSESQSAETIQVDRYKVVRPLGAGGMGVVYEAFDEERNTSIALKVMRISNAAALYRFKKEFRVLADLHHPNVVSLYELVAKPDRWYFTMELVDGVSFREYVRPGSPPPASAASTATGSAALGRARGAALARQGDVGAALEQTDSSVSGDRAPVSEGTLDTMVSSGEGVNGAGGVADGESRAVGGRLDVDRLRPALRQLASGIAFLHQSRCLHRDIKPSNVLVTAAGRVVLCDFGLVKELAPALHSKTIEVGLAGTINYMSPEQAAGEELSEASDWYSVGVMLYEALAGKLPFHGSPNAIAEHKQRRLPPSPAVVNPEAPEDLSELCMELLRIHPSERPSGGEVVTRLGVAAPSPRVQAVAEAAGAIPFVGRETELQRLEEAFAQGRPGRAVTVLVHGTSGMGKSALLQEFLERLRADSGIVVLAGRCYERESVPYKGFDSIVDSLSAHLLKLDRKACKSLVPRDVMALSRLFPVLRRVDAIEAASILDLEAPDPQESRRRAVSALRELLRRVALSQPLVLCIDDLQWGDAESGLLLGEILRPPEAPPLLLLLSYRSEEVESTPLLQSLEEYRRTGALGEVREISVDVLPREQARQLAASTLGNGELARHVDAVAAESRGSPFFVNELARYVLAGAELRAENESGRVDVSLDNLLAFRIAQLSEDARKLLSVIAVAGHPVEQKVAARAATLTGDHRGLMAELRQQHLVRSSGARDEDLIETYHDRIRESVVRSLDADELRRCHERLARAYEERGHADPEILVEHWHAAGRHRRASSNAAVAAEEAAKAFAFDRAARLYRLALDLGQLPDDAKRGLRARLGDALANAGRGAEAAEVYLEATAGANTADALELRRRAAECWLHTGHFGRGLDAIRTVLEAVGIRFARTPKRALFSLLSRRLWLRVRGTGYKRRDPTQVSAEELTRIDILRSVASGLSMIDPIFGADFNTRHLLAALEAGEPHRVARALAVESAHSSTGGSKTRSRTIELADAALALATEIDDPSAIGLAYATSGLGAFLRGEWKSARELCSHAEEVLRDRTTGTTWELTNAQVYMLASLFYLGDLESLGTLAPARLREAEERGNLWFATGLRARTNAAWLALDDPEHARAQVERASREWPREGYLLQHYYELIAHGQIDLYVGRARDGLERVDSQWKDLSSSLLLRVQNIRVESQHLVARCALAEARATGNQRLLDRAARAARQMGKEKVAWAEALEVLVRAAVAASRNDHDSTLDLLDQAEKKLAAADMGLYAAVSRYYRGRLLGGDAGEDLVRAARREISSAGARNPERFAAMLAPGFAD